MSEQKKFRQLTLEAYLNGQADQDNAPQRKTFTVTEVTELIRTAISAGVPQTVWVVGEMSNVSTPGSGHVYFTLKDDAAQVRCAMWRPNAARVRFALADGLAVLAEGSVEVYAPRGQYQLIVETLQPYGLGELELAFRQLRDTLDKEGLFDPAHKKPLPPYPFTIAVVTSETGAAVRDILRALARRWPVGRVLVYPVGVQGEGAGEQIAEAIGTLNAQADRLGGIDVMIVARGGGSLEDLWAFNTEPVARAIHQSTIPVVSGVGHEIDVTIADLVADVRAATPTAAAECVVPVLSEVIEDLSQASERLGQVTRQQMTASTSRLDGLAGRGMFVHPIVLVGRFAQGLDELTTRMGRLTRESGHDAKTAVARLELALGRIRPEIILHRATGDVEQHRQRMHRASTDLLRRRAEEIERQHVMLSAYGPAKAVPGCRETVAGLGTRLGGAVVRRGASVAEQVGHLQGRLAGCDPRRVLKRGFAIARRAADNKIVSSIARVRPGDTMVTELKDGRFAGPVETRESDAE